MHDEIDCNRGQRIEQLVLRTIFRQSTARAIMPLFMAVVTERESHRKDDLNSRKARSAALQPSLTLQLTDEETVSEGLDPTPGDIVMARTSKPRSVVHRDLRDTSTSHRQQGGNEPMGAIEPLGLLQEISSKGH